MTWYLFFHFKKYQAYHDLDKMVWVIGFLKAGWSIKWMGWKDFLDTVLTSSFQCIRKIAPDLIVGGLNLATDYI